MNYLGVSFEPLVSIDYKEAHIQVLSMLQSGRDRLVKVLAWYDNEWGFHEVPTLAALLPRKAYNISLRCKGVCQASIKDIPMEGKRFCSS